jgi:hypothetical protein
MKAFDWQLHKKGYIPMSGQIVDASLVPAPSRSHGLDGGLRFLQDEVVITTQS